MWNKKWVIKKQNEFVLRLKDSLDKIEQHLKGKIRIKTDEQLLNEL